MSAECRHALSVAARIIASRNDEIQRALQVLQKAQPHDPVAAGEMQPLTHGDWIDIRDVVKAIRILQEGQQ